MTLRAMGRLKFLCAVALLAAGCDTDRPPSAAVGQVAQAEMFAPTAMRVHPIFTQIAEWNHTGKPDGIEAQLEFTDQFGDPTKASGKVLFELFGYQKEAPDPRGRRVGRWVGSLTTLADQRERWNTTLRTYRFQLDYPAVSLTDSYVLTATFELSTGGRFFDRIVLAGKTPEKSEKKHTSPLGAD